MNDFDGSTCVRPQSVGTAARVVGIGLAAGAALCLATLVGVHFGVMNGEGFVNEFDYAPHVSAFGMLAAFLGVAGVLWSAWSMDAAVRVGVAKLTADSPDVARRKLYKIWFGSQIVRLGLVEGPLVLAAVFFFVAGDYLALGVAGVLLAVLVTHIPAADAVERFLNEQGPVIEDLRRTAVT